MRDYIDTAIECVILGAGNGQLRIDDRHGWKQRRAENPHLFVGFPVGDDAAGVGLAAGGGYGGDTDNR